jgi:hypothetical protein
MHIRSKKDEPATILLLLLHYSQAVACAGKGSATHSGLAKQPGIGRKKSTGDYGTNISAIMSTGTIQLVQSD